MQKLLGGAFFVAAAIYLAVTGGFNIITILAIMLCAVCAGLSTKNSLWAVLGGAGLISGSLLLQTIYTYRCADCLKADAMVLCGVICLAIMEEGQLKKLARVLAGSMAAVMFVMFILAAPPVQKSESSSSEPLLLNQGQNFDRYLTVNDGQNEVRLDTSEKAVLLFSPDCGACKKAVEELVKADPQGERWIAVQAGGGDQEGRKYLDDKGYKGNTYILRGYAGAVPAFVSTTSGQTRSTHDVNEMLSNLKS